LFNYSMYLRKCLILPELLYPQPIQDLSIGIDLRTNQLQSKGNNL
jgi:hypothetical protein